MSTGRGTKEIVAACSSREETTAVDPRSFTRVLIDVLEDAAQEACRKMFTVASLHGNMVCRRDKLRYQPIHAIIDKSDHSIALVPFPRPGCGALATPSLLYGSTIPSTNGNDTSRDGARVLLMIHLEQSPDWDLVRFLKNQSLLPSYVSGVEVLRIEAMFDSNSTVVLVSVPIPVWDLLPDHEACKYLCVIRSSNLCLEESVQTFFDQELGGRKGSEYQRAESRHRYQAVGSPDNYVSEREPSSHGGNSASSGCTILTPKESAQNSPGATPPSALQGTGESPAVLQSTYPDQVDRRRESETGKADRAFHAEGIARGPSSVSIADPRSDGKLECLTNSLHELGLKLISATKADKTPHDLKAQEGNDLGHPEFTAESEQPLQNLQGNLASSQTQDTWRPLPSAELELDFSDEGYGSFDDSDPLLRQLEGKPHQVRSRDLSTNRNDNDERSRALTVASTSMTQEESYTTAGSFQDRPTTLFTPGAPGFERDLPYYRDENRRKELSHTLDKLQSANSGHRMKTCFRCFIMKEKCIPVKTSQTCCLRCEDVLKGVRNWDLPCSLLRLDQRRRYLIPGLFLGST
jgi:hypothetical protein